MQRPFSVLCMIFVLTILLFYKANPVEMDEWEDWDGRKVTVTGKVLEKEVSAGGMTVLLELGELEGITVSKREAANCLLAEWQCEESENGLSCGRIPYIGETVQFAGTLSVFDRARNPGAFDARFYYYSEGIIGKLCNAEWIGGDGQQDEGREMLSLVRQKCGDSIADCMDGRYSGILQAMLLGMKGNMNEEVEELFYAMGIGHIIAISGLHISTIGRGINRVLNGLGVPLKVAGGVSILLMYVYGVMTGMSHSAYRAILMFALAMFAKMWGRTYDSLIALSLAAVVILLENPLYLYQSGFLLSFCAVLGAAIPAPAMKQLFLTRNRKAVHQDKKVYFREKVITILILPVSIQLFTLPVQMYFFYEISVYSLLLNLAVIPLMTIVLISGLSGTMLGVFHTGLGSVFMYPAERILGLCETLCQWAGDMPGAEYITGKPEEWVMTIYYIVMTIVSFGAVRLWKRIRRKKKKGFEYGMKSAFLISVCLGVVFLFLPWNRGNKLIVLDVGQGDGLCILTESDNCILIDGGSSSRSRIGENVLLPTLKYYGVREIAYSIVTHPDTDHCSGIVEILELGEKADIPIRNILLPVVLYGCEETEELCLLAEAAGTRVLWIARGDELLEQDVHITCVHPTSDYKYTDMNDASLGLYMEIDGVTALLMGDIEAAGSEEVMRYLEQEGVLSAKAGVDILKVAHHGSRNATTDEFVDFVQPDVAIISCGENNSYGHPHEETLAILENANCRIYTTVESGAVVVNTEK